MGRKVGIVTAVAAGAVGILFLAGRFTGSLWAGETAAAETFGYARAVPGPVTAVLACGRAGEAFVGAGGGVYRSADGGRTWARIFRAGIWRGPVRGLASDVDGHVLYVAAGNGLYRSAGTGFRWRRILDGEGSARCVAVSPHDSLLVLAGTERGVRVSRNGGEGWERPAQGAPEGPVDQVLWDPARRGTGYLLSARGVLRSEDGGRNWTRVWVNTVPGLRPGTVTEEEDQKPLEEQGDAAQTESLPRRLAADGEGNLYLGSDRGVLVSSDAGATWRPVPTSGIGIPSIRELLCHPSQSGLLYAATSGGLFLYSAQWQAWRPIREGLGSPEVGSMGWDPAARELWVGTRKGFFRLPVPEGGPPAPFVGIGYPAPHKTEGNRWIPAGPPIAAVQTAAIRYAEVQPEKISRWRALARWRSLFPSFTIGLDQDRDATIASSTTQGVTRFTVGPERKALSLDFGFTWDLADLVWNPDQTSIDVRSRLMVQLRQDLLEEVTRLYFERERLLAEFAAHPSEDPLLGGERSLRVEELTAQLNALTGGWFLENLEFSEND